MKKLFLASALTALTFSAAHAADAIVYEPVPETPIVMSFDWTGAYIGGQVGYGWGNLGYTYSFNGNPDTDYDYNHDPSGFISGVYAGYNHQFSNNVILGADADIVWSNLKDSSIAPGDIFYSANTKIDWMGSARLRLGYAYDRFMPYIAGGVAFGDLKFDEYRQPSGTVYGSADKSITGWTIGAGAEYAMTDQWILRGEYRYTDFGKVTFTTDANDTYSGKLKINDFRIGVAYKF